MLWHHIRSLVLCGAVLAVLAPVLLFLFHETVERREIAPARPRHETLRGHVLKETARRLLGVVLFYDLVVVLGPGTARVLLGALVMLYAALLRAGVRRVVRSMDTKERLDLPAATAAAVDELAARAGVRIRGVLPVEAVLSRRVIDRETRAGKNAEDNAAWLSAGRRSGFLVLGRSHVSDLDAARAVVAHELGHAVTVHPARHLAEVMLRAVVPAAALAATAGHTLVLMLTVTVGVTLLVDAGIAASNRRTETAADRFAVSLVGAGPLRDVLARFNEIGYGSDVPGLADNIFSSHPHTHRRLSRIPAGG